MRWGTSGDPTTKGSSTPRRQGGQGPTRQHLWVHGARRPRGSSRVVSARRMLVSKLRWSARMEVGFMSSNLRLAGILASLVLASGCVVGVGTVPGEDDPGDDGDGQDEEDPPPTTPVLHSILSGSFSPLGTYTGISGRAELIRSLGGRTEVSFQIIGVSPNTAYVAHVHAQ